jgi:nicotinate phosphoribosyltransferase
MVDLLDHTRRMTLPKETPFTNLLVPVFRSGKAVYEVPPLVHIRQRAQEQLTHFHAAVKRFDNPQPYPVGLERQLYDLKNYLISQAREATEERKTHGTERSAL